MPCTPGYYSAEVNAKTCVACNSTESTNADRTGEKMRFQHMY